MRNERGFTLVELIMVIVIIGILAVAALPQFYELRDTARRSAMDGTGANVQAGIATWHYNKLVDNSDTYPDNLDVLANGANCSSANKCFDNVLATPVNSGLWQKTNKGRYLFNVNGDGDWADNGTDYKWIYTCAEGTFLGSALP